MSTDRPYVLSIAGFDPSGGAGVLSDVKTFETLKVQGLAVLTANTLQTESRFIDLKWMSLSSTLESLTIIASSYQINAVKIGIVPSIYILSKIARRIRTLLPKAFMVWDPIIQSTTDYEFFEDANLHELLETLKMIDLVTPNFLEIEKLTSKPGLEGAKVLSGYTAVLLKGGHNPSAPGTDYLLQNDEIIGYAPKCNSEVCPKHGSGCVLSSAIAAYVALGKDLKTACQLAKNYTLQFLTSNASLTGHHVQ